MFAVTYTQLNGNIPIITVLYVKHQTFKKYISLVIVLGLNHELCVISLLVVLNAGCNYGVCKSCIMPYHVIALILCPIFYNILLGFCLYCCGALSVLKLFISRA